MGYASSADRHRDRRGPAWLPLAVAAVVVPTVLAGLTLLWPGPQIQTRLGGAATEALAAAGLTGARVSFDGRDATISGVDGPDAERAVGIVEGVTGVRVAGSTSAAADTSGGSTAPSADPAAPPAPFEVSRRGEDVVLTGVVGSEEDRAALVRAATAQAAGRTVVDELTVSPGATSAVDAAGAGAITTLVATAGDGATAALEGDTITLTGTVPDQGAVQAASDALTTALPGVQVDNGLTVAEAGAPPTVGAGGPDAAGRQQLQSAIDALVAGAPITFEPDSATLTAAGSTTVSEVLDLVRAVPAARLQVDGFVATGPGSGRLSAQELSDGRAATVRDVLVAGGVPAENVVARGLGEGDDPAAAAAGRRVDITVV